MFSVRPQTCTFPDIKLKKACYMVTAATVLQVDAFVRFPVIRREGFVSKHHGIYSKEAKSFQCMYIIYMYE